MWEIIPNYDLDIYKNNNSLFIDSNNENEDEENNEEEKGKIKVLYDSFKVEEFLIKDRPYQQLSDHFGISVELFADSANLI